MQTPALVSSLREKTGMTLRDVAKRCGVHFGTVWKAEHMMVRWETIYEILTTGMGITAGSADYERIKAAWLDDRVAFGSPSPKHAARGLTPEESALVEQFVADLIARRARAASAPKRPAKGRPSAPGKSPGDASRRKG